MLKEAGHDIAISAQYGLGGNTLHWEGIKVYPSGYDTWGNDVLPSYALDHLGHANNGWIFTLFDSWVFQNAGIAQFHNAVWAPVDHKPVPPPVLRYFTDFNGMPIAMSKFGQEEFAHAGLEALYIPHGIDPVYEPKSQVEAREAMGIPADAFVVGMNAHNKGGELHRKGYSQAFQAFSKFAKEDCILYVQAESHGHSSGWDLERYAQALGIKVKFADQFQYRLGGVPPEAMPHLYSAFDVFLNPAYGEGFGIPIVEAQACGVPVIVTDWTSMPELVGDGWVIDGIPMWHESQGAFWKIPDIGGIVGALEDCYARSRGPSRVAVKFAEQYRADRVFTEFMLPVFAELSERIDPVESAA
jgi:glycosyltransferase involved in cell wall biosynthesis